MSRTARLLLVVPLAACVEPVAGDSVFEGDSDDGAVHYVLDFGVPPAAGEVEAGIAVRDEGGAPIVGATLAVDAVMPGHGHGLAGAPPVEELGEGEYRSAWSFPMAGTWAVTLTADGAHAWVADVVVD